MGARHQGIGLLPALLLVCALATVRAAAGDGAQAAGSTLCCTNTTGYHECVKDCFDYYPREQAEKFCDPGCQEAYQCRSVSGDKCPSSGQPASSELLTDSDVGEVVVQAAVATTTLCCSNMTGFHECVEACFAYFPREQADKICDPGCKEAYQCHTVSGDKCPSGLLASSAKGDAVGEKCVSGCRSSVCSKMVTGVGSKLVAVKHALERCNNACTNFCTNKGGLRTRTSAA